MKDASLQTKRSRRTYRSYFCPLRPCRLDRPPAFFYLIMASRKQYSAVLLQSPFFLSFSISHSLFLFTLSSLYYGPPYQLDDSSAADMGVSICNKAAGSPTEGPIGLDKRAAR